MISVRSKIPKEAKARGEEPKGAWIAREKSERGTEKERERSKQRA